MLGSNPIIPRYLASLLLLAACGPASATPEGDTEAPPPSTGPDDDPSGSTAATEGTSESSGTDGSNTAGESGETDAEAGSASTTGTAPPVAPEVWRRPAFTDEEQALIHDLCVLPSGEVLVPWSRNDAYRPERWRRFSDAGDPLGDLEPALFPSALGAQVIDAWLPTSAAEIVFSALAEGGASHRLVRIDLDGTTLEEEPVSIDGGDATIEAMASNDGSIAIVSRGDAGTQVAIVDEAAFFQPVDTLATLDGVAFAHVAWLGPDVVVFGGLFLPRMGQPAQRGLWRIAPDGAIESFVGPDEGADNWYTGAAAVGGRMLLVDDAENLWLFDGAEVASVDLGRFNDVGAADGGWFLAPRDEYLARKVSETLETLFEAEPTMPMWPYFVAADGLALLTLESPEDSRRVDLVRYAR